MTAYLMIGGPAHGEIKEILHGRKALVPDPLPLDACLDRSRPSRPGPSMAAYTVWTIPMEVMADAPDLPIMKLDEMSDVDALRHLGLILRPRFEAIQERLSKERGPEGVDKFRAFLDEVDLHHPIPGTAWLSDRGDS